MHLLGHGASIIEKQQESGEEPCEDASCWPNLLFKDQAVADGSYSEHEMWTVSLTLLHELICLELRKKDLDLIAMMVMHSFSAGRALFGGSPGSRINGADDIDGVKTWKAEYLTASSILRFSLLKLLFSVAERCFRDPKHILSDLHSGTVSTFSLSALERDNKGKSVSPIISGVVSAQERESLRGPLLANFCAVFGPDWFLCVLERVSDITTFTTALRLLVLCLQSDTSFRSSFCSSRGWSALRSILMCRPQGLSVILPLLALLLNIPVATVPQAKLLMSSPVAGFSMLLTKSGLAQNSSLDKKTIRDITLPSLSILLEAVSVHASAVAANKAVYTQNEDDGDSPLDKPASVVSELILNLLVSFTAKAEDCNSSISCALHDSDAGSMIRSVLQSKDALAAVTLTLIDCSTAVRECGYWRDCYIFIGEDTGTGNTIDMTALLGEDHFSEARLAPSCDDTDSSADTRQRRTSVRYIEDDTDDLTTTNAKRECKGSES